MGDIQFIYLGRNGIRRNVTAALTGMPQNLPKEEAIEMTDWEQYKKTMNRLAKAKRLGEEEMNERHNHQG